MPQSAAERLGVADFKAPATKVGNVLLYPRRIIISVLKALFADKGFFTQYLGDDTDMNPFLYKERPDGSIDADSRLIIGDQAVVRSEANESRPRIIVDRVSGSFQNGRFSQQNGWTSSTRRYQDLFRCDMVIRCVGRHKLESELLGLATAMALTMFYKDILKGSQLHEITIPSVGPTSLERGDSEPDQYVTTLTMSSEQPIGWEVTPIIGDLVTNVCIAVTEEGA